MPKNLRGRFVGTVSGGIPAKFEVRIFSHFEAISI